MYLDKKQKELIEKEIKNLENKSSAELVAVITKISSSYKFEILIFTFILTFCVSVIALFFELNTIKFFQIQILSFIAFYLFLSRYKNTLLFLLPKNYKYNKASKKAKKEFYNLGIEETKTRQGIMFFVSIDEKYVEIVTDIAIKSKIDNIYWEKIVNQFINDVKNKQFFKGYKKAIQACSQTLIENFPIKENDKNELKDEVIEL